VDDQLRGARVNTIDIVVYVVAAIVFGALAVGLVLVVRDTVRQSGRWGINLAKVACPECGAPAPLARMPDSSDQAMWGGHTCSQCGTRYDKWGKADPRSG
jgi:hypothetical protein